MATVQHPVMNNKKRRPIIYRTKSDLNETFLLVGDHLKMHILVQVTLIFQVFLTTRMEVLQIRVHKNNKLNQIDCPKWKIL